MSVVCLVLCVPGSWFPWLQMVMTFVTTRAPPSLTRASTSIKDGSVTASTPLFGGVDLMFQSSSGEMKQ